MKLEMRQKLAREPFAEKTRKVGQLVRLAKTFPRRAARSGSPGQPMIFNRTITLKDTWAKEAQRG